LKIISFSGIDGAGKGTQITLLKNHLKHLNVNSKVIWARGSWTPGIELLKKIVRKDKGFSEQQKDEYRKEARTNPKKQKIILILSLLDLFWYWGLYYRIVAMSGKLVICDRYIWDTYIDFKVNFSNINFEKWAIWKILMKISPIPYPSFVFMISADESVRRGLLKQEAHMESLKVKTSKIKQYTKLINDRKWSHPIDGNLNSESIHRFVIKSLGHED
jgi:thymidylate kinase